MEKTPPSGPAPASAPEQRDVASSSPSGSRSLARKNRWKRRGGRSYSRFTALGVALLACICVLVVLRFGSGEASTGPDGPFAQAVYEAFPEADAERIETIYDGDLPVAATLHLPAHLIKQRFADPFARLGAEFGGAERTLSGIEMASRIERVAQTVLPDDMPRCHTYEVGDVTVLAGGLRRTRALYLRLNPGC